MVQVMTRRRDLNYLQYDRFRLTITSIRAPPKIETFNLLMVKTVVLKIGATLDPLALALPLAGAFAALLSLSLRPTTDTLRCRRAERRGNASLENP